MSTLLDYALTSVADVKETLGIAGSDNTKNNLIIRKINQATEIIEGYCGRRFKATDYVEYYDGTGLDTLTLRNWPVISFTSIENRDTSLNDASFSTVPGDRYFVNMDSGLVNALGSFFGSWDRWKVTYRAGYATIPQDIAEAAATLAAYLATNDGSQIAGVAEKQEGGRRIRYMQHQPGDDLITRLGLNYTLDRYTTPVLSGLL